MKNAWKFLVKYPIFLGIYVSRKPLVDFYFDAK